MSKTSITLAEALLLRKQLQAKVQHLQPLQVRDIFEVKVKRQQVSDSIDDIVAQVPKISMQQATHAYDWHAKALREVDAVIQRANWTAQVELDSEFTMQYVDPYVNKN